MKEEDTTSQLLFWEMMNDVLLKNGCLPANFKGFMADEAGANWRAVRTVFNNGADKYYDRKGEIMSFPLGTNLATTYSSMRR